MSLEFLQLQISLYSSSLCHPPPLPQTSFFGKRGVFKIKKVGKKGGLERVRRVKRGSRREREE
jgi:hypothetical protein